MEHQRALLLIVAVIFIAIHVMYHGIVSVDFRLLMLKGPDSFLTRNTDFTSIQDVFPTSKNVTPPEASILIYNRVPKSGSTTIGEAINRLAVRNKFHHWHSKVFFNRALSLDMQRELLKELRNTSLTQPVCYNRHMYFFDQIRSDNSSVIWLNVVRDPVQRLISQFYYLREYSIDREIQVMNWGLDPKAWFSMDLNTCVEEGDPLCRYELGDIQETQLTFFCGTHKMCSEVGNRHALQLAKYNVENYYSVVGVMEEMKVFFKVVQRYIPRFFKDIFHTLIGKRKLYPRPRRAKPKVSNSTINTLKNWLKEDYELYEFIRQRLHLQAKYLNVNYDT